MGFANGWKIIELADANVKQGKKVDKKGKGRVGESEEERTVNDRSRALLFNVSELGDGFEKILKRVKAEQGNKEIGELFLFLSSFSCLALAYTS